MFENFSANSRVWIYKSNRELVESEQTTILNLTRSFLTDWAAHGNQLFAEATILDNWALVIAVNENMTEASGCSIDSKVKFVKSLEEKFSIEFFNRMNVLIRKDGIKKEVHFSEIGGYSDWQILNPMLSNMQEFRENLWIPIKESQWV